MMTDYDRNIVVSVATTAMIICYLRSLPLLKQQTRPQDSPGQMVLYCVKPTAMRTESVWPAQQSRQGKPTIKPIKKKSRQVEKTPK